MKFNFDRSKVLGSIRTEGDTAIIALAIYPQVVRLPRSAVKCIVTPELDDSSVQVVDFGKLAQGQIPHAAIIGVGHESKVFTL